MARRRETTGNPTAVEMIGREGTAAKSPSSHPKSVEMVGPAGREMIPANRVKTMEKQGYSLLKKQQEVAVPQFDESRLATEG